MLCMLRGSASCGHLGLWPAAALANHSCCPNAVGFAVGDRWVRRSARARACLWRARTLMLRLQCAEPALALRRRRPPAALPRGARAALPWHTPPPPARPQVLRAAEALPQGAEVSVSYLGSLVTAPYRERREELMTKYGFECGCDRCAVIIQVPVFV